MIFKDKQTDLEGPFLGIPWVNSGCIIICQNYPPKTCVEKAKGRYKKTSVTSKQSNVLTFSKKV